MTKKELELEKMLDQQKELQKKIDQAMDDLNKERDDLILGAIHEIDITREQGYELANILRNKDNLETILKLAPKLEKSERKRRKRMSRTNTESEVNDYEE